MDSSAETPAINWPIRSYIEPIRSVLFVDDRFPTYAVGGEAYTESIRAKALWRACTERGWLCDMDNSADWSGPTQARRIASCDLLVLDYHLVGDDPSAALKLIRDLSESPAPNLVVVYTAEPDLDGAFRNLAAHARGVRADLVDSDIPDEYEGLTFEWSVADLNAFLAGERTWRGTFVRTCREAGVDHNQTAVAEQLLEQWFAFQLKAPRLPEARRIQALECGDNRWFQCGNLFVALIGKPLEQDPDTEADTLLDGLKAAISAWSPPWLACLVAATRHHADQGAFRDDLDLPAKDLQNGLLHYIAEPMEEAEKRRRAHRVAAHLLDRRFTAAAGDMANYVLEGAKGHPPPSEMVPPLMHANAFLCSERFTRHHLRVGTVFRSGNADEYWVCVTPACDMVPRARNVEIDPWGAELDPFRAMTAIRLDLKVKPGAAIRDAEQGRYVFFYDYSRDPNSPIAAGAFNPTTGDPNPRLERMFAADFARTDADGRVRILRMTAKGAENTITLGEQDCFVACQLRAPYAERLSHVVGGHISRVGVDFLSHKKSD